MSAPFGSSRGYGRCAVRPFDIYILPCWSDIPGGAEARQLLSLIAIVAGLRALVVR
jgi:hypothetical protein